MKLKYEDYTKRQDVLNKLSNEIVISYVSARDKTTGLFTSANLVHSVTFAKTFILIRLNEGSNLVLNLLEDGVEWNENKVNLNFDDIVSDLDLLNAFKRVVLQYLYVD
jgi:hypothetical protein